jgi:hypothetical protein
VAGQGDDGVSDVLICTASFDAAPTDGSRLRSLQTGKQDSTFPEAGEGGELSA